MMMVAGCLQVQWYESAVSSRVKDEAQVERSRSVPCLPGWCSGLLAVSCSRDQWIGTVVVVVLLVEQDQGCARQDLGVRGDSPGAPPCPYARAA